LLRHVNSSPTRETQTFTCTCQLCDGPCSSALHCVEPLLYSCRDYAIKTSSARGINGTNTQETIFIWDFVFPRHKINVSAWLKHLN
jgi:hypothetical protein